MIKGNTVYIVIRTLTVAIHPEWDIDTMPVIEGVFASYDEANDFVDPLLDDKGRDIEYSIIERVVQ